MLSVVSGLALCQILKSGYYLTIYTWYKNPNDHAPDFECGINDEPFESESSISERLSKIITSGVRTKSASSTPSFGEKGARSE